MNQTTRYLYLSHDVMPESYVMPCIKIDKPLVVYIFIGLHKQTFLSIKVIIFSYPSVLAYVLGAQKNHLIEMVLFSTHNTCFG